MSNDRTPRCFARHAAPNGIGQDALHRLQVGDLRPDLRQVTFSELPHVGTWGAAIVSRKRQQSPYLVQRKAEFTRPAYEGQPASVSGVVDAIATGSPGRWRQHADALVIADCLDVTRRPL